MTFFFFFHKNLDVRRLSFEKRRFFLEKYVQEVNHPNISISSLMLFNSWDDLRIIKEKSLNDHIEGIMLKK